MLNSSCTYVVSIKLAKCKCKKNRMGIKCIHKLSNSMTCIDIFTQYVHVHMNIKYGKNFIFFYFSEAYVHTGRYLNKHKLYFPFNFPKKEYCKSKETIF